MSGGTCLRSCLESGAHIRAPCVRKCFLQTGCVPFCTHVVFQRFMGRDTRKRQEWMPGPGVGQGPAASPRLSKAFSGQFNRVEFNSRV